MADDLRRFDGKFPEHDWPNAPCPECRQGDLAPMPDSIIQARAQSAIDHQDHPGWEPEWIYGSFHGVLQCQRSGCRAKVTVVGEFGVEFVFDPDDEGHQYDTMLQLRFALPSIPLATPPVGAPAILREQIDRASGAVWTSPGATANGLRRCVETLLDEQKINKTRIVKGRRRRLTTHERIELMKAKNPVAAASLEAVKWLGNQGSHEQESLTASDCIEGAELLDHALRILYDKRDEELVRRAAMVNKARGVRRSRKE